MREVESKTIKKLRNEIIKELPKFLNNKETKQILEEKSLINLLIDYLSWKARLVAERPRDIIISKDVSDDPRWNNIKNQFGQLSRKITSGENINPYLSLEAHQKGYTPASSIASADTNKWEDKDFLLNITGFHHLHLGHLVEGRKISGRTDDVIFAKISRETFKIIGVFDHSVFNNLDSATQEINCERSRLWDIFDNEIRASYVSENNLAKTVVMSSMITTSAHPLSIVLLAQEYLRIIFEFDKKLGESEFVNSLFLKSGVEKPKNPKIVWYINGTDLGLLERNTGIYAIFRKGIN